MTRTRPWTEILLAILVLGLLIACARALRIDDWLQASLGAFLGLWGIRVGVGLWRSNGRRTALLSGLMFSAGGWTLAMSHALPATNEARLSLNAGALVFMISAVVVFRARRNRAEEREPSIPR
jgi:hypothetical protein